MSHSTRMPACSEHASHTPGLAAPGLADDSGLFLTTLEVFSECQVVCNDQARMFYMVFKKSRARQASRLELLREATEDALHQDARCGIMPHIRPMVEAAVAAGAHGAPPRRREGGLCCLLGGRDPLWPLDLFGGAVSKAWQFPHCT